VDTYLIVVYLTILSVAKTIQHQMTGFLVNNELKGMCKESAMG
jgi:hypothetical protein